MPELRLSQEELGSGVVFVKSDCYPIADQPGRLTWIARHPSGWEERGAGSSHEDCVRQVNEALARAMINAGYMPATTGTSILRRWEGDKLTDLRIRLDGLNVRNRR